MIYPEGVEERETLSQAIHRRLGSEGGTRSPTEHDLVLVAILNTPRDLEIARTLGWYRIPLGTAPRTVRVDWLAFYLPAAFAGQRWSVRYLAEVRGIELLTRRELLYLEADHPRAAHPYYKLQLGPLLELDPPIPSRGWRRFSFLYTTGDRLYTAVDLTQLRVPASRARERLWRMLRDRAGFVQAAA
ncbi:MAG: hypothetical protein ACRDHG_07080 [Anaerolineales bacterium]